MSSILKILKVTHIGEKRHFTYITKVKLINKKNTEIIVLHPIFKDKKNSSKNFNEIIYDAQEALGLARSAGFKISHGISMPSGGWEYLSSPSNICNNNNKVEDENNLSFQKIIHTYKTDDNDFTKVNNYFDEHKTGNDQVDMTEHSASTDVCYKQFEIYDNTKGNNKNNNKLVNNNGDSKNINNNMNKTHEKNKPNENNYGDIIHPKYEDVERKIAESILIKVNRIDNKFYFNKGKINEISKYYLKNPTPYIFINTILSPEQFQNLDFLFNSILKSYHDELKLNNKKHMETNYLSSSRLLKCNFDNEISDNMNDSNDITINRSTYFDMYNNYVDVEDVEEDSEKMEFHEDEVENSEDIEETCSYESSIEIDKNQKKKHIPLYVEIFDRYSIILYILKSRAKSNLSKLQLELARANFIFNTYSDNNRSRIKYIKYIENNVLGKSFIDQEDKYDKQNIFDIDNKKKYIKMDYEYLGYNCSFIKSTETYKEYEKRIINNIYNKLKKELIKCKNNNNLQNNSRKHKALIAIVGYTNVGKTKLINCLTNSNLKAKNLLFQTLDNSYKSLNIANSHSTIFIDSVGFIQNVPYSLYESFMISLEAIKKADIIIHVIDVTHPYKDEQKKCVLDTLVKIGITNEFIKNNIVEVWNKIDKLSQDQLYNLYKNKPVNVLPISSKHGTNCDVLINIIQNLANKIKNVQVLTLSFSTSQAKERIDFLMKKFKVVPGSISYSSDGNTTYIKLVENPNNLKKYYEKFKK
ncbi:GTP-binding protein, putative [Plasmodium berghei]|uniref:GTP-binding protein, putative n=3 Tax=Plasmodium berghei TaxID=5821 RepID=A0A509AK25_PLABA|nr:GTP-binding protein, putative [Plasmodium berghei ANKA]CXI45139.1 GTP-binding protein, putative [Plasmodium berghei]SCN25553.1 GTP-binding protein, putative [Plasmodium berghei]SCO60506.1 GTP-binding protein, putative [Plasmodium berghei]VUC55882.1 GTP-binding protein, putative [Plasmodium berghei ANKA]|eukprot:XP_034421692.1 GTP-binding protein, putative [Plasmodium berghei ANKA]